MAIKGSLSEATLPDVIQLLSYSLKSGCLSVTDGKNFGNIFIRDGKIIYATLLNRKDRLGDILLRKQLIDEAALRSALEDQRMKNKRLGEILVETGTISKEALDGELTAQIMETVFTMLTWESGYFNFEADLMPSEEEFTVQLAPQQLLLEGARRIDEWKKIENKIPPFETALAPRGDGGNIPLTAEEQKIMALIDGTRTIDEILKLSEYDFFETCRIIYGLLSAGLLEKPEKPYIAKKAAGDLSEYKNLGFAFFKTEMFDEAEREFKKILEIDAKNAEALMYCGLIDLRRGSLAQAKESLLNASKIEKRASIFNNLGYLCNRTGAHDEAISYLNEGRLIAQDDPRLNCNLAIAYFNQGDFAMSAKLFNEVMERTPEIITPYIYMSVINIKNNEIQKSLDFLRECMNKFPRIPAFKNNLAVVYEAIDLPEEAEKAYRQALEDNPQDMQVCRNFADFYYEAQILGAAKELFERIPDDKKDWEVLFKLGNISMRQGDTESALIFWEKAKDLNPQQEIISKNIELLQRSRTQ
jgi:Flp pilus assembly protein TadD